MIDPYAPLVVALTHSGFPMSRPLPRREWEPLLAPGPSFEDVFERVRGLADFDAVRTEIERLDTLGIWAASWFSPSYPESLYRNLSAKAPPVVFGLGPLEAASERAIGMVGSRDTPSTLLELSRSVAAEAVQRGYGIVSGGANGADLAALSAAGVAGGTTIAFAADRLAAVHRKLTQAGCNRDRTVVLTPYHPESGFTVGQAMGRNKLIYAASSATLVVHCDSGAGGTWSGAVEALKAGWVPVAVWTGEGKSEGNLALERLGAIGIKSSEEFFALAGKSFGQASLEL